MSGPTQAILPGCSQASLPAPRVVTYSPAMMITRRVWAAAAALAVLGLAGCGPARTPWAAPAATTQAIDVHGLRRTFHVSRPPVLSGPAPLVIMLHGGFGTGTQAEQDYHWDATARAAHFVVAYPDGLDRAWNAGGGCCGVPGRTGV